jgi:hypothetical protein
VTGLTWYPGATQEPLPTDMGGMLAGSRGLVLHVQAGDNDPWAWFDRPDVQASSHWWVGKDGRIVQYVPADRQAWAQAAGNAGWHSVETEGTPDEPLTSAQIATLGRLYAWGHQTWGWPLQLADTVNGAGFGTHGMGGAAWGGHTGCPGPARTAQRTQILTAAAGGQPTGDDVTLDDIRQAVRDVLNEATAAGQRSGAGTIVADLTTDQADYNLDAGQTAALARIESFIGSLSGNLSGPPTPNQVLGALSTYARGDVSTIAAACLQILATAA